MCIVKFLLLDVTKPKVVFSVNSRLLIFKSCELRESIHTSAPPSIKISSAIETSRSSKSVKASLEGWTVITVFLGVGLLSLSIIRRESFR